MSQSLAANTLLYPKPRYLWFLILAYAMIIAISNWFEASLIKIFGITMPAGTLVYPLTFLLSDIITEVYGFKYARQAIWSALFFNIMFVAYGQIVILLPSPDVVINPHYKDLLSLNFRIILASFFAYIVAEPINSYLIARLKIASKGKYMGLRFMLATFFSSFIDTLFFFLMAFYGLIENTVLQQMIISSWAVKMTIELLGLPFSIRLSKLIKRKEEIDIYDESTGFSFFKFDTAYPASANKFGTEEKNK